MSEKTGFQNKSEKLKTLNLKKWMILHCNASLGRSTLLMTDIYTNIYIYIYIYNL